MVLNTELEGEVQAMLGNDCEAGERERSAKFTVFSSPGLALLFTRVATGILGGGAWRLLLVTIGRAGGLLFALHLKGDLMSGRRVVASSTSLHLEGDDGLASGTFGRRFRRLLLF